MAINPLKRAFHRPANEQRPAKRQYSSAQATLKKATVNLAREYCKRSFDNQLKAYGAKSPLISPLGKVWSDDCASILGTDDPKRVIKIIKPQSNSPSDLKDYQVASELEVRIHKALSCLGAPHIPRMIASFNEPEERTAIVMEKTGLNLAELFLFPDAPSHKRIQSLDQIEPIAKKILEAFSFLHAQNILHGDFKLENSSKDAVLDFGLSCPMPPNGIQELKFAVAYRPPEVILQLFYGLPADIWSIGCALFSLYTSQLFVLTPKSGNLDSRMINVILHRLQLDKVPDPMAQCSPNEECLKIKVPDHALKPYCEPFIQALQRVKREKDSPERLGLFIDLLSKMLEMDPDKRITADQALDHPFFTGPSSTDISFKLTVSGQRKLSMRVKNSKNDILADIDLSQVHKGSCFHIPKTLEEYIVEIYDPQNPFNIFSSLSTDLQDHNLEINTDVFPKEPLPSEDSCDFLL